MKRFALFGMMLLAVAGMQAQNCEALLLPYFGSTARMAEYPADKVDWYCCFVHAAFYESDTVPASADLYSISEVQSLATGEHLSSDLVVDLATLSYYAYNFHDFQLRYPTGDKTLCFATPASAHPYLVLRSIDDMTGRANREWESKHLGR